jgi:hypothetical protein
MIVGSMMEIRLGRESAMGKAVLRQNLAGRRRLMEVDRDGLGKAVRGKLTGFGILHPPFPDNAPRQSITSTPYEVHEY